MVRSEWIVVVGFLVLHFVSCAHASGLPQDAGDPSTVTMSGISAGGYFAVQMHVAYSSMVRGVGVIAGGPFDCINNNPYLIENCMKVPLLVSVDELILLTAGAETSLQIDQTHNLRGDRVWLFSGSKDTMVAPGIVRKVEEYYNHYVKNASCISATYDVPAEHSFVTDRYGHDCDVLKSPFINNCGYDTAGKMLEHLYGPLKPRVEQADTSRIISFDQCEFIPDIYEHLVISMSETGYAFVPENCSGDGANKCRVHVALHGCGQNIGKIDMKFVEQTGYNEWAQANDIIVIYPQLVSIPDNLFACWDWWGYTGEFFPFRLGPQMQSVYNMIAYVVA